MFRWLYNNFSVLKIIVTALIILWLSPSGYSQNYSLIKEIEIKGQYLKLDNFGNSYVLNEKNELQKFKSNGDKLQFYNEVRYGKIGFVDVSNPMKPLVYYPSYNTIRILDVTLSDKGKIALMNLGLDRVNAMCLSLDNNIWIYDEISFRLKKINDRLEVIQQSEDLTTLLQKPVRPNFILEKDNLLMVNDSSIGILVFDIYATYNKIIPIKGLKEFQKIKDVLYFFKEGTLQSFNTKTLQFSILPLPKTEDLVIDIKVDNGLLNILTENKLLLYSY
jgi:hypothetical protein